MSLLSIRRRECLSSLYREEIQCFSFFIEKGDNVSLLYKEEGVFLFSIEKGDTVFFIYEEGRQCLSSL